MADDEKDKVNPDDKKDKVEAREGPKAKFGPPNANYTGKVYNPGTGGFAKYVNGKVVK